MSGISVIICCYNSAGRLPATLRHLAAQACGAVPWEVVVVDNNSSDATAEVARQQWQQLGAPAPLTVVPEPRPGLSMARDKGLAHVRHGLVLFCDDDNWLEADYLREAHELMRQTPSVGVLGGLNTAVSEVPFPPWFKEMEYSYACGPQAEEDGEVSPQRLYVTGAGMVVRGHIFRELAQVGFKSQLLDRRGEELSSGGDAELCFAAALLGYKIVYSSRLKLFHSIEAKRLSWNYVLNMNKGHGKSYYKLDFYKKLFHNEKIENSWLIAARNKIQAMLSKHGVYVLYQYYINNAQSSAGIHGVEAVFYFEMVKAHFHMRQEYARFLRYLNNLKTNIVAYHASSDEKR